ncbi:MAG: fructosamine kinase family protein [Pseudomonadota bacterium]
MPEANLRERLVTAIDMPIVSLDPMQVGFGLAGAVATLKTGQRVAIKARQNESGADSSLALEGAMLADLRRLSDFPVPEVYVAEPDLLVMDYIENDGAPITPDVERDAAALVASLHATPRANFGYERDTLIGPLHQPNPRTANWVLFFRDHRLLYMAKAAKDEGGLSQPLFERIERFAERLADYLSEPSHPSLVHGDLWTGNVLTRDNRIAGFIDPAIYFGHPEIELAFTTMFGTFGHAFFKAYEDILPLEPGFHEVRRDIYNLYPTLVHVRLFGGSYVAAVDRILTKFGA